MYMLTCNVVYPFTKKVWCFSYVILCKGNPVLPKLPQKVILRVDRGVVSCFLKDLTSVVVPQCPFACEGGGEKRCLSLTSEVSLAVARSCTNDAILFTR